MPSMPSQGTQEAPIWRIVGSMLPPKSGGNRPFLAKRMFFLLAFLG